MNKRTLRISPSISWYLRLDVLNYLKHSSFGIRANVLGEQKYWKKYIEVNPVTHWHHQTVTFFFCDAFPGFYCSLFQLLFVSGVFPFNLLYRRWNACSIGSGDWLGPSKTFNFFSLMKSFAVLAVCFAALSCCMMNFLPISLNNNLSINWQTECICRLLNSSCC